jgi:hypothetical protein
MVMQTMRSLLLSTLLLLAVAAPATAGTSDCVAPPGTAAIEEYCETVPSATGDKGGGIRSAQPLDRSTRAALRAQGADGQALAGLLRSDGSSAPGGSAGSKGSKASKGARAGSTGTNGGGAGATQDEPSGNPLHAVTSAVEAGPTLGGGFAWALLGITALMIAAGWIRLRARRD